MSGIQMALMAGSSAPGFFKWSLGRMSYSGVSLDIGEIVYSMHFKPDGTKLYLALPTSGFEEAVYQYSLPTAWDLSTAFYDGASFTFPFFTSPAGLTFKPDGTKMYIGRFNRSEIYEYDLTTAWDLSTATDNGVFYNTVAQGEDFAGLFFKPDGLKMYVSDRVNDTVWQYRLSAPWDLSTASFDNVSHTFQEIFSPDEIFFKDDGSKLYVIDTTDDGIRQYDLSTAWDITTASYRGSFLDLSEINGAADFAFKGDGLRLYVARSFVIYQYNVV